jgi:uncharacterized protein (DUF488 family)
MTAIEIFTIGHSNHPSERFIALLRGAEVTAVADVRSAPYSRHAPQFNRDRVRDDLERAGIAYVFLGQELGGRPAEREFYADGVADYEKMAQAPAFAAGLERVIAGAQSYRIALMCRERDPLTCHRCLLVGRALVGRGARVSHILDSGEQISHTAIENELLVRTGRAGDDLFAPRAERLAAAYRDHARKVAFAQP